MAGPALNEDKREWAIKEVKRLEEENAALKKENEALKAQIGEGGGGETPVSTYKPSAYKPGEGDV